MFDHPMMENTEILLVKPALEPGIDKLGLPVSFDVTTYSRQDRGEY